MQPTGIQSYLDDPQLQTARSEYETAAKRATSAQSQSIALPDMLKDALNKKFSQNHPLVQQRESALKEYLDATTSAPLSVTAQSAGGTAPVIYNPLQQADLIQRRRSIPTARLATSNYLLNLAQGGVGEQIESAARGAESITRQLLGEAELKRGTYEDLFKELSTRDEQAYREREFAEKKRQFDLEYALNKSQGGGTAGERSENQSRQRLLTDAKRGTTFKDLVLRYKDELPASEIRSLYNQVNYYKKPAKESEADIQKLLGGSKVNIEQADNINSIQSALEDIKEARNAMSTSGTGPVSALGNIFGEANISRTNSAFGSVNTRLFDIAGKAFTGKEKKLIEGLILDITKQEGSNKAALDRAEKVLKQKLKSYGVETKDSEEDWDKLLKEAGL